jgi:SSS family solute:Na+ symporter
MGFAFDGSVLASLIIPSCFIFIEQDMAQRCFAAKTPKDATKGCLYTALVLILLSAIPTICGILGQAMGLMPENGAIFMQVMKRVANPFVFVMASSSVLLAIISTASAVLLALSSNVAQDMTTNKKGRLITLGLGVGALLGPYVSDDIISWMVGSYAISVGALFIPIMAAVFTKRTSLPALAGWGGALMGSIGTALAQWFSTNLLAVALPFVLSFLGFVVGWFISIRQQKRSTAVA